MKLQQTKEIREVRPDKIYSSILEVENERILMAIGRDRLQTYELLTQPQGPWRGYVQKESADEQ